MRIESDILAGPGQGEIDAAAALVANREITLPEDGHVMGTGVVVGMHHAVDAGFGYLLAGPVGVCRHESDLPGSYDGKQPSTVCPAQGM